jgi:4-hydroxy-tetrahydrodipicolinate reductase
VIRVGIHGAKGRMGTLVCQLVSQAQDMELVSAGGQGTDHSQAQVVIDFSLAPGPVELISGLQGQALVTGCTGLNPAQTAALQAYADRGPLIWASNFSSGMNLLFELASQAARSLPDYHLEIVEMHHGLKQDAPSGSALTLATGCAQARGVDLETQLRHGRHGHAGQRTGQEIGMHALRGGDVAGEHTLYLAGPGERLMLGHLATSRTAFAGGAIRAARWLVGKQVGAYTMGQVLAG